MHLFPVGLAGASLLGVDSLLELRDAVSHVLIRPLEALGVGVRKKPSPRGRPNPCGRRHGNGQVGLLPAMHTRRLAAGPALAAATVFSASSPRRNRRSAAPALRLDTVTKARVRAPDRFALLCNPRTLRGIALAASCDGERLPPRFVSGKTAAATVSKVPCHTRLVSTVSAQPFDCFLQRHDWPPSLPASRQCALWDPAAASLHLCSSSGQLLTVSRLDRPWTVPQAQRPAALWARVGCSRNAWARRMEAAGDRPAD